MTAREDLKILLIKENITLTELAKEASKQSGQKYTVHGISQKLIRDTMKYNEFKFLAEVLEYKVKFEKTDNAMLSAQR